MFTFWVVASRSYAGPDSTSIPAQIRGILYKIYATTDQSSISALSESTYRALFAGVWAPPRVWLALYCARESLAQVILYKTLPPPDELWTSINDIQQQLQILQEEQN